MTELTKDTAHRALEVIFMCNEAKDEVIAGGEVVEVAGVEEDVVVAEEMDGEGFVGGVCGGVAEGGVPAGFGVEEFDVGMGVELGLEMREILFDAGEKLRAERVALTK
jgi:hypothetical protein